MIDFDKISVPQIIYLSQIINESALDEQEFIQARYSRVMQNYQTTIEFLRTLNMIDIKEDTIIIKPAYEELLRDIQGSKQSTETVNKYLIKRIFNTQNEVREYSNQFLSCFTLHDENYEFRPTLRQKLQYSGIRNFLMELHLIDYDSTAAKYVIQDHFVMAYPEIHESRLISDKDFKKIQKLKEKIGKAAEEAVLEYEKNRLSGFPYIVDKIEHIAIKDVSAGYDIKSFECSEGGTFIPRLIEVKAVSICNYRFYWTKNEIDTSKINSENYYLYLLPVYTKNSFDLENMKIIQDPFINVYKNKEIWIPTIETMSYSLYNETQSKETFNEA